MEELFRRIQYTAPGTNPSVVATLSRRIQLGSVTTITEGVGDSWEEAFRDADRRASR